MNFFLEKRLEQFHKAVINTIITNSDNVEFSLESGLTEIYRLLLDIRDKNGNVHIIGNGGSASIASHAVVDFMNVAGIRAHTLHDPATLTCMAKIGRAHV